MPDEAEESAITDQCGYNQTQAIVNSYPVRDLLVSCRLRVSGQGRLAWFLTDGQTQFLLELSPAERQAELRREGALVATTAELSELADREMQFELSLCDRQALLALDGRVVLMFPYLAGSAPFHPTSRPVAVGTQDLGVELRDLKLFRDVYYTPPQSSPAALPGTQVVQYRLGADEYFMLGDNSPVSADSRSWFEQPAVARELLAGKPFVVYFPSRFWSCRGLGFQVPDPSRIRYIH
jgi:signal peptidase I